MRRPAATLPAGVLVLAAVACVLAPALMLAGMHSPLRVGAALLLFGLAPGAAVLPWLSPRGGREPALLLGVSLALSLVATQIMLWASAWSPQTAACLLAAACLVSLSLQLALRPRERA